MTITASERGVSAHQIKTRGLKVIEAGPGPLNLGVAAKAICGESLRRMWWILGVLIIVIMTADTLVWRSGIGRGVAGNTIKRGMCPHKLKWGWMFKSSILP